GCSASRSGKAFVRYAMRSMALRAARRADRQSQIPPELVCGIVWRGRRRALSQVKTSRGFWPTAVRTTLAASPWPPLPGQPEVAVGRHVSARGLDGAAASQFALDEAEDAAQANATLVAELATKHRIPAIYASCQAGVIHTCRQGERRRDD